MQPQKGRLDKGIQCRLLRRAITSGYGNQKLRDREQVCMERNSKVSAPGDCNEVSDVENNEERIFHLLHCDLENLVR